MRVFFTTEVRERILDEARTNKSVLGHGGSLKNPAVIDAGFPLTQRDWDFISAKGKEHLKVYHQGSVDRSQGSHQWPTNLTKVREVR